MTAMKNRETTETSNKHDAAPDRTREYHGIYDNN
jgi:hypothetical protein